MEDIIYRSTIGTGGFIATLGLQEINTIISIMVGLATFGYMVLSIMKILKGLKK
jgi:hypothetical protein